MGSATYGLWQVAIHLMSEARLQALAKMMRSGGTPSAMTARISASEAQSKPAPAAASTSSSAGSPLHLGMQSRKVITWLESRICL